MVERKDVTRRSAFTLIELLVVITIIAILVSLTLAAGTKVVSVGRERGTQWALQALDTSVGEYIQANGSIPPATVRDPLNANRRVPIIDGGVGTAAANLQAMDSVAWYVYQLQAEGSSALAAVHQIDARLRKTGSVAAASAKSDATQTGARTTQILDVWGNPMRYVHPRFGGVHGVGDGLLGGHHLDGDTLVEVQAMLPEPSKGDIVRHFNPKAVNVKPLVLDPEAFL